MKKIRIAGRLDRCVLEYAKRSLEGKGVVAIYDEYNHNILPPTIMETIQTRHPVPNHGARLIVLEDKDGNA